MIKLLTIFIIPLFLNIYLFAENNLLNEVNISTETKINQKKTHGNFWDVKISTTEILEIREEIKKMPQLRGIHITSWIAGEKRLREKLIKNISKSVINGIAIAIKEKNGKVYLPNIKKVNEFNTYEPAIKNPEEMIKDFKKINLYLIARIVCFHDSIIPKKYPNMAVKNDSNGIWKAKNGDTWVDPYNKEVWDYILDIAEESAKLGFDEIQFDYVRYPTEGNVKSARFSKIHNKENANKNIMDFLKYAKERLSKYNVKISADVFGLTTNNDMGIGQDLNLIALNVDYVYPMMYPSHYYKGEYNLKNPDSEPYKVINRGLKQAMNKTGKNYAKIRPYLQDFSLKHKYGVNELKAQIIATRANLLDSWILWNPSVKYTWEALTPEVYNKFIEP